ncbi:MAG: topoisomerase DNA-binding C4 zinc finger domain-containing protein [Morganella sp. (in: enterobacteria)]
MSTSTAESCPECGGQLVIRNGAHGPFFGCSAYPGCDYIRPLKAGTDGHIIKVLDGQLCPQCGGTLVLRQGRYGMFIGCGNYPECEYVASMNSPDETTMACPQCHDGKLLQRKSRFGKTFYACNRYPACQFSINNQPVAGECEYCHYPLLVEKKTAAGMRLSCASKACAKQQKQQHEKNDES